MKPITLTLYILLITIYGCDETVFEHDHEMPEHSHSSEEHRHNELYEAIHRLDDKRTLGAVLIDVKEHNNERLHLNREFVITAKLFEVDEGKRMVKSVYRSEGFDITLRIKYPRIWNTQFDMKEMIKIGKDYRLLIKITGIKAEDKLIECDLLEFWLRQR